MIQQNKILNLFTCICLLFLFGCKTNSAYKDTLMSDNRCWDVVYNSNRYLGAYIYGYCFYNDSQYYAYHYYGAGKTPFDYGSYDIDEIDTTIINNLFAWKIKHDTLFLQNDIYIIDKIDDDTIELMTGIEENPLIKLSKSKN